MMNLDKFYLEPTPVVDLKDFHPGIKVWMKRDELIHPILSGNKWRKLKYNLREAKRKKVQTLVTKGGYFSNNLAAVSEAGKLFGFKTIGIIRGEQPKDLGYTLKLLLDNNMELIYTERNVYKDIDENNYQEFTGILEHAVFLPEGGTNLLALKGCQELIPEILNQIDFQPDFWCVSVGTGGTVAGMYGTINDHSELLGFSALKGDFHLEVIQHLIDSDKTPNLEITDRFAGKGYAKLDDELIAFMNSFYDKYQIPLDPVYTGKMMQGIYKLADEAYFPEDSKIIAIHTGGLQGLHGYKASVINYMPD